MRCELVRQVRRLVGRRDDVAAADIDGFRQGEGHGLAGRGLIEIAVIGDDTVDMRPLTRGEDRDFIAATNAAAEHAAGIAPEVRTVAIDPLHGEAEGARLR